MAKLPCDTGSLTVGSLIADLVDVSAEARTVIISAQAMADVYAEKAARYVEYTINATAYTSDTAPNPLVGKIGTAGTCVLNDQNGTPTAVFNGAVIITGVGDQQRAGEYHRQTITMVSNGVPTAPA